MNRLEHYKTIDPSAAKELQQELRGRIKLEPLPEEPAYVAGADISFNPRSDVLHAAIVVLDSETLEPVDRSLVSDTTDFPYIPGLLAFREMPALLKAWKELKRKPDVLILDGHGIAHPRRMGIATHFGIEVDHPTIGCAKNLLTGSCRMPGIRKGETAPVLDEETGEQIGMVVRSRTNVNPVYVSPGHLCSFEDARSTVMKVVTKYKLPRTTRLAHRWANKLRKG